nr:translation initiation factor IF-2-like [Manis javanica]
MGPRGPGAGAGSGGGGLGRRQRPRRPHANRLPAPTPLPPRGGRRAGRRERGRGRGRGGGGEERARGARRAPGAAGRSGSGGARLQPAKRPPARRGPAPAATARRLLALQPRRHPRGAAPGRSPGRPPAPLLGLASPSGAEPAGCGMQDAGEPHSDTGGPAWLPPLARPGAPRSSAAAPLVQAASTLRERPIRAQRGGRAAGLASIPPPAGPRCRRRPRVKLQRAAPQPRAQGRGRTGHPQRVQSDPRGREPAENSESLSGAAPRSRLGR